MGVQQDIENIEAERLGGTEREVSVLCEEREKKSAGR